MIALERTTILPLIGKNGYSHSGGGGQPTMAAFANTDIQVGKPERHGLVSAAGAPLLNYVRYS